MPETNIPVPDLSEPRAERYPLAPNPQPAPLTIADNPAYPQIAPVLPESVSADVETEEVAVLDNTVLTQIAENPEIAEALAKEGLAIDTAEVARAIEENKKRAELELVLAPHASVGDLNKVFTADENREEEPQTELDELKQGINSSFEEVASLLLEHQRQIDEIEARLVEHNRRGGHKI